MNEVIIKTPEEIEKMRELGKLVAEALDYIGQFVKPGITTNEIDKLVYDYHVNVQGGYPAPLHYGNPPYPKSCCTSVNHVICHGIPDDKPLKEGDIINIDLTIKKDGFHGDSSRMFAVGKVSPIAQRRRQTRRHARRCRLRLPAGCRKRGLFRRAGILRPRHRTRLSRSPASPALRPQRPRPGFEARYDFYYRTDD